LTELGDPLKQQELDLFFNLVDKNGDGRLQYDEFLGFLRGEREADIEVDNEEEDVPKPGALSARASIDLGSAEQASPPGELNAPAEVSAPASAEEITAPAEDVVEEAEKAVGA
jgi:hypothetical protein